MRDTGYRAFLATRHVPSIVIAMTLARLPMGVVTLVLVLFVSMHYGAAVSGLATAAFTAGVACFGPVFGRMVDRGRGPQALRALGIAELCAVTALVGVVDAEAPAPLAIACSFAAGALTPPIAGTTRSLWPHMLDMRLVSTAYNFEVLVVDLIYVGGPLAASVFIAFGKPEWGLMAATIGCTIGSLALASLAPVQKHARCNRLRERQRRNAADARRAKPRLMTAAVALLLLVCLARMCYAGWMEALIPLFYASMDAGILGSAAISAWSIGAAVGVVLFNRFQPSTRTIALRIQLPLFAALFCAVTLFGAGAREFPALCLALFVIGMAGAPCDNLYYQIGGPLACQERQAEMFSWLNTATSVGVSAGAFFAGVSVEAGGFSAAFALPVACSAAALMLAIALARRIGTHGRGDARRAGGRDTT